MLHGIPINQYDVTLLVSSYLYVLRTNASMLPHATTKFRSCTCAIHEIFIPQITGTAVGFSADAVAELVARVTLVDRRGAAGVAVPRDQDAVSELWRQRAVDICK